MGKSVLLAAADACLHVFYLVSGKQCTAVVLGVPWHVGRPDILKVGAEQVQRWDFQGKNTIMISMFRD